MKVAEILAESQYLKELGDYILDLLVAFRANKVDEIDFGKLLKDVQGAGFDVDQDYLVNFLKKIQWIQNVDPATNKITLKGKDNQPQPDPNAPPPVDPSKAKVSAMADKAAGKALKEK